MGVNLLFQGTTWNGAMFWDSDGLTAPVKSVVVSAGAGIDQGKGALVGAPRWEGCSGTPGGKGARWRGTLGVGGEEGSPP